VLQPYDILVLLKLVVIGRLPWTYDSLAHELGLSASAAHRSVDRATESGLFNRTRRRVELASLHEVLVHGVRYFFPPVWGGEARGIPTAWAAPPLSDRLAHSGENPPVWPSPDGQVRGIALEPLDPRVRDAIIRDEPLHELLALVDAIRIGNARERSLAANELRTRMKMYSA
jgi:DNA-binding Lrp family transcriptional regulator